MSYLKILGQKHASYGADVAYIDGMAIIFLSGIKPILEREASVGLNAALEVVCFLLFVSCLGRVVRRKQGSLGKPVWCDHSDNDSIHG